jgi:hypothetical protein
MAVSTVRVVPIMMLMPKSHTTMDGAVLGKEVIFGK